jgi:hypothetical protein
MVGTYDRNATVMLHSERESKLKHAWRCQNSSTERTSWNVWRRSERCSDQQWEPNIDLDATSLMKMSSLLNDGGGVTINPAPSLSEQQGIMMGRRGRGEDGGDGQRASLRPYKAAMFAEPAVLNT